jgi:PAS domain S-box-containing protein
MSSSAFRNMIQPCSYGMFGTDADGKESPFDPQISHEGMEPLLAALVENAPVPMAMFDRQMNYMLANRAWIDEFGLNSTEPLIGRSHYEVFPYLHPGWKEVYEKALQGHVMRSEQDAQGDDAETGIVYRWEVRPWQRRSNASVEGLMITCERFARPKATTLPHITPLQVRARANPEQRQIQKAELAIPEVLLDDRGIILKANAAAVNLSLARGLPEKKTTFWQAFARTIAEVTLLKSQLLDSFTHLQQPKGPNAVQLSLKSGEELDSSGPFSQADREVSPASWLIIKPERSELYTAIALPPEVMTSARTAGLPPNLPPLNHETALIPSRLSVQPMEPAVQARLASEHRQQPNDLSRTVPEGIVFQEVERDKRPQPQLFQSYLHALPCGVLVLDDMGRVVFQNQQLTRLLGQSALPEQTVEDWLAAACPDSAHRHQVASVWREDVWRRQLTRCFSLATADGWLKALEFQPTGLPGGGLLVCIQDATEKCLHEDLLRLSENKSRAILQASPIAIARLDKTGAVLEVNGAAEHLFGQSRSELQRHPIQKWLDEPSATMLSSAILWTPERGTPPLLDLVIQRAETQDSIPVCLRLAPVVDADGQPHHTICFFQPKPQTQPSSTEVPSPSFSAGPSEEILLLKTNIHGRIKECTARGLQRLGLSASESIGRPLHLHFCPSDATSFYEELRRHATLAHDSFQELTCYSAQGQRHALCVKTYALGAGRYDFAIVEKVISPQQVENQLNPQAEVPLTAAQHPLSVGLRKDHLAKIDLGREHLVLTETHHRIKNHLQIVSSLLNLESNTISDPTARLALQSSQNRVLAIADLNQHLYEAILGSGENFITFVHGLVHRLRECYAVPATRVNVQIDLEASSIQREWLMPLALILNESLSNCFEHAFPEDRPGVVRVIFQLREEQGELKITDDGIGMPLDCNGHGHGLKILSVFAEQMRGQLWLGHPKTGGTEVLLRFPIGKMSSSLSQPADNA